MHYLASYLVFCSAFIYNYNIHTKRGGEKPLTREKIDSKYHSPFQKQYKIKIM